MDTRIKELIDFTKTKFGLGNYYLHTYELCRDVNIFNETIYTLSMEWFPNHITEQEDEDLNPDGTAAIDITINTRQFKSVIFVGDKSYTNKNTFKNYNKNDIIHWIENETGLKYGNQFQLVKEEVGEYCFRECIDGVAVSPSGSIEIEFDAEGKLTHFSVIGQFPSKDKVARSHFSLQLEDVEKLAKDQFKLFEFPSDERKQFIPLYGIEEIYVTNDKTSTIPYETIVAERARLEIGKILHWNTPIQKPFERKEISLDEEVTLEQAFSSEPHPDSLPISKMEQEQCVDAVEKFLRQVFPKDCGKWILKTLRRDKGFILATLKRIKSDMRVFQRKLLVFLDRTTLQPINYMDNREFLEIFQDYEEPEEISLNKDDAYEKIKSLIELKPVYVYDFNQDKYRLCGEIDCQYGVNASNGEVISLKDI
ncbi:hypothetical protein DCC39_09975 [Pueribacillus theae]|uniref:DUF4901 domain-containing protein n=1 Tax=Pueribacillus theae TaxID=2171751 RepID=A0A2U1K0X4_9BACI|nr:hypothetical protein [Pueribacillus theae]PWA11156.1 hypothetical protein DCC39_09975 [Pueribacillus theae]